MPRPRSYYQLISSRIRRVSLWLSKAYTHGIIPPPLYDYHTYRYEQRQHRKQHKLSNSPAKRIYNVLAPLYVSGVVALFLAGLLIHTWLWYGPGGRVPFWERITQDAFWCHHCSREFIEQTVDINNFDKPWPLSYLAWLFDPSESAELVEVYEGGIFVGTTWAARGIDIDLFGLHIRGSGALTGDFDYSTDVERGQNVVDAFGRGVGELMLLTVLTLFVSIGVVVVQRRGRPPVIDLPYSPSQPMTRRAAYRTSATNELFRVQFGGVYSI